MTTLERLKDRDYYIVIDKSGSMSLTDTPNGQTRFKYTQESTTAIANKLEQFDPDGLTLLLFGSTFKVHDNVKASKVEEVFLEHDPIGGTTMTPPLQWVFDNHNRLKQSGQLKKNGSVCVVVTDGAPNDGFDVAKAITDFSHTLDNGDDEFGLLFCQVGNDPGATEYLRDLDDKLTDAKFDIVDAKTFDEIEKIGILAAMEAALDD